ncbi:hypothetical protein [Paenibacillus sp. NPDC093718]|uniref:hypothetical protein n=1 Tax=Paenibacillus sp. NPDC093718 TaxID=3390601 RepID=UPI003CFCA081
MKIKQFYGSLVGNHFEEMSIRLLCSLIDQRLENGIPSLKLRMSLLEEIKRLNGMPNRWVTERQRNIEQKIVKDIREYPDVEPLIIHCTYFDGRQFSINLNEELILWDSGNLINSWTSFCTALYQHDILRIMSAGEHLEMKIAEREQIQAIPVPVIYRKDIVESDNPELLDLIFSVTPKEMEILRKKLCKECGERVYITGEQVLNKVIQISTHPMEYQCVNCKTVLNT